MGTGLGNYSISYVDGDLTVDSAALTITADSTSKTYGQTATFAGTEFTESGLVNGDTITGVTLTSAGAVTDAPVAGSQYAVVPSGAVGTGLGNYTISYVDGGLTVGTSALKITADSTSKTYGQTLAFSGTEFTESGLVNVDTITGVTLTSAGAIATAVVASSPYTIVPSGAAGTGLGNYSISYVDGGLTVDLGKRLTITADSTSKTYGQTATFAGTEFTESGLVNDDTITGVTLTSRRSRIDRARCRVGVRDRAERGCGNRTGQLHDRLCERWTDCSGRGADDHGGQHEQDVRSDGDVPRDGVHRERPCQRRHDHRGNFDERRGRIDGFGGRLAVRDRAQRSGWYGPGELHDQLC